MEEGFSKEDLKNILVIFNRVQVSGNEALGFVLLQQKIEKKLKSLSTQGDVNKEEKQSQ